MKKLLLALTAILTPCLVNAESLDDIFKKVNEYVAAKNYSKALEELSWARKEIEKMNSSQVSAFFPDTLAGLTGEKFESSSALGMSNASRTYKSADAEVKVSITGASGGGNEGLGALMGLGKMAAMMNVPGQEAVRVQGKTATLNTENESSPQLMIYLDSGSVLQLEGVNGANGDLLKKMADGIKVEELDKYLKG